MWTLAFLRAMKQLFAKPKKTSSLLASPTNQRSLFAVRQPFDLPTDDPIEVRASQRQRRKVCSLLAATPLFLLMCLLHLTKRDSWCSVRTRSEHCSPSRRTMTMTSITAASNTRVSLLRLLQNGDMLMLRKRLLCRLRTRTSARRPMRLSRGKSE